MTYHLTHHASDRARSRGVQASVISSILDHFDIDHGVGDGCRVLRLSRHAASEAAAAINCPSLVRTLMRTALVENQLTGSIVTVMRDHGGGAAKRYRRPR